MGTSQPKNPVVGVSPVADPHLYCSTICCIECSMSIDHGEPTTSRKSLPLTPGDQADLELMLTSNAHREVLSRISGEVLPANASEARVLHALLTAGLATVREELETAGYAQIAAEHDLQSRKAVARRRRPNWADE